MKGIQGYRERIYVELYVKENDKSKKMKMKKNNRSVLNKYLD
jgi:hypothetical protein